MLLQLKCIGITALKEGTSKKSGKEYKMRSLVAFDDDAKDPCQSVLHVQLDREDMDHAESFRDKPFLVQVESFSWDDYKNVVQLKGRVYLHDKSLQPAVGSDA